jgi:hypothetical protein
MEPCVGTTHGYGCRPYEIFVKPVLGAKKCSNESKQWHFDAKPSNNCQPNNLVARPVSSAQIPVVMIYTQNDTFCCPALSEWLYGAWTEADGDRA